MSFHTQTEECTITIPAEKLDAAHQALTELNTDPANDHLKSYQATGRSFMGMTPNYHQACSTAQEVFEDLGFDTEQDECGLTITHFSGKYGDQQHFFAAVAHLVDPGSFVHFRGENGSHWRFDFDGQTVTEREGTIVYT